MNEVHLIGNVVKPMEAKTIMGTNEIVVVNTIAVRRDFKNVQGEYDADFINFVAYRHSANYLSSYIEKGDKIALTGRWQTRKYTKDDGTNVYVNELVVGKVEFLAKPQGSNQSQEVQQPEQEYYNQPTESKWSIDSDDLPF